MQPSAIRARREALENLWRQGLSGKALLERHTLIIDEHLAEAFSASPAHAGTMALVAVGGYGRIELFPFSDIDLLLLYEPGDEKILNSVAEAILYPLWDAGLDVGHSVRTADACLSDAENDFFLQVSLLDSRLIAGSDKLFSTLLDNYHQAFIKGRRNEFLQQIVTHRITRHRLFGLHSYLLEPNVKVCRGGLRDIQSMQWTARVLFGMKSLSDLQEAGILTDIEHSEVSAAWDNLIRIRNRLHYISGRKNDQLFFEHQEQTAEALGYATSNGVLGVEKFMGEVHAGLKTIAQTADIFFEHAEDSVSMVTRTADTIDLHPGISLQNGSIHLTDKSLLAGNHDYFMLIFLFAARNNVPVHYWTRKAIRANHHLLSEKDRCSSTIARSLLEILTSQPDPLNTLISMLETGVMTSYIPELQEVASLSQHDVYHTLTVDRHLLQTVSELHRLAAEEPLFQRIKAKHVLFIAGLLHDIGKGSGADHSEKGAELAAAIGTRLHLPQDELDLLIFLIKNHLFLAKMSQRRDLEDESFIPHCARLLETTERLTTLYILTIADAKATGPSAWSNWKSALLLELYLRVSNHLVQDTQGMPDPSQGAAWMRTQVAKLFSAPREKLIEALPENYLLVFTPEEIARHISLKDQLTNAAAVHAEEQPASWTVTVISTDATGLLARICGALALHNLSINQANIFTWPDGTVVDVFEVRSTMGNSFSEQNWDLLEQDLNSAISGRMGLPHRLAEKYRDMKYFRKKGTGIRASAKVVIDNSISAHATVIEIYAQDHPKLLYDITRTLADFEITITHAKISTAVDQIVDVFYACDSYKRKLTEPELQQELHAALLYVAEKRNTLE
ncbi:MAG: [protein-PII] uridylyltransferase [Proteobacteria bacterium]|nr:[protein-PII] uridylyltransferase [Pseudomonadota bacterium]MBU1708891.1 [protein-PII] uridylyltransferase [Pseudomonadota bacterium]